MSLISLSTASARDIVRELPNNGILAFALSRQDSHLFNGLIDALAHQIVSGDHLLVDFGGEVGNLHTQRAKEAAFRRLHKFGKRITKALCLAQAEHPYKLHPYITYVERAVAGHPASSHMLVTVEEPAPPHVDRGLFNLVVGTTSELTSLELELNGNWASASELLPADDQLYAVMIPGLTLHCLVPAQFAAVTHRGDSASSIVSVVPPRHDGNRPPRTMIVFQWRLDSSFQIPLQNVLGQVPSFRDGALATGVPAWAATGLSPDDGFQLIVRTLTGQVRLIQAKPGWTVLELKGAIEIMEEIPADWQRLIFSGWQLEDGRTLASYGLERDCTVQLVGRLMGD